MLNLRSAAVAALLSPVFFLAPAARTLAQGTVDLPAYLQDRGTGTPTSMFGTYARKGDLLVYPFYEYYLNGDEEYNPDDFGFDVDEDFEGKYTAHEELIFLGYGLTDDFVMELEAGVIQAVQEKDSDDPSDMDDPLEESGLSDVQIQLDYRWLRETETRPEIFNYLEVVFPTGEEESLIGTAFWEYKLGMGAIKGSNYGTFTARVSAEYTNEDNELVMGEYAVEYLKRLSPAWRVYLGVEGEQDEIEFITEAQWHINENAFVKINNAFGVTPKSPDWAPEVGIMFVF